MTNVQNSKALEAEVLNKSDEDASERPKDRFRVRQVNFTSPEPSEDQEIGTESSEQPESPHNENFTQGYTTNEAVPMTMFYRNSSSTHNEANIKRPTLQELRRGLENDSPLQVS